MAYNYSRADWDGLHDHLRDIPWNDLFKLSASCAASQFCEWVQVGIDLYISHCMYQVNPHSSPWFSATCAAAIVQRNHLFRLHQQNKSSESILHMLIKQRSPSFPTNLALETFFMIKLQLVATSQLVCHMMS